MTTEVVVAYSEPGGAMLLMPIVTAASIAVAIAVASVNWSAWLVTMML